MEPEAVFKGREHEALGVGAQVEYGPVVQDFVLAEEDDAGGVEHPLVEGAELLGGVSAVAHHAGVKAFLAFFCGVRPLHGAGEFRLRLDGFCIAIRVCGPDPAERFALGDKNLPRLGICPGG